MARAHGRAPDGGHDRSNGKRNLVLGRCAGVLFLSGAAVSAPANQLLSQPDPGWYVHLINLLALVSGLICLAVPWDRIDRRWLHAIPFAATGEIVLSATVLGPHGEVYLWFFVLGAVFTGYAFRRRLEVAAHMSVSALGLVSTAVYSQSWDHDSLVRALVAVPTLGVAAGAVTYLREGLETRERRLRALFEERERESRTDALTGLANRRALLEALTPALAPDAPVRIFALFDLDGFKLYNDRFGHLAGDELLERLAARLAAAVDGRGRAYRLGGDEFCVLLDAHGAEADTLVQACVRALEERGSGWEIAASHGAVVVPREATTLTSALSAADERMYACKQRRRAFTADVAAASAPSLSPHERRRGSRAGPDRPLPGLSAPSAPDAGTAPGGLRRR